MASTSTPKRIQSIESGQIEPALYNTHTLPTSSLPPELLTALGLRRDSLSLYKVFHNSHEELEGSGSRFVGFQNYGGTNAALASSTSSLKADSGRSTTPFL